MAQGGSKLVKFMLFFFNFVFFLTGLAIIVGGSLTLAVFSEYDEFTNNMGDTVPIVLICVGVFIFITGFFGCCGAMRENYCMLYVYAGIILLLLAVEIAAGITGYVLRDSVAKEIDENMLESMQSFNTDEVTQELWNHTQTQLDCCGTNNYTDWFGVFANASAVPKSCCLNPGSCDNFNIPANKEEAAKTIHTEGCSKALKDTLSENLIAIIIICVIVALVEITGVFCACCLMQSVKNEYEVV